VRSSPSRVVALNCVVLVARVIGLAPVALLQLCESARV